MKSLTAYMDLAKKKGVKDYFGTAHVTFPDIGREKKLVNAFPDSLGRRRLHGLMGTFTDYMIRKFFRDGLIAEGAKITKERELVSAVTLRHLPEIVGAGGRFDIAALDTMEAQGEEWVRSYLEEDWDSCVDEVFLMSQIDSVFRARQLPKIHYLKRKESQEVTEYLSNILEWLRKVFSSSERVYLNPLMGHPDVCKGDADLVVDNTLFEIKTVKRPWEHIRKSKDQLLGYVALFSHHKDKPVEKSPQIERIDSVGFLFPQSLAECVTRLDDFTHRDRMRFCQRIVELRADEDVAESSEAKIDPRSYNSFQRLLLLQWRGYWRSEAGRFEEAEAAYRSAIEFDPAFIEGWVNLGLFLINRGRFEEAERTLEEAMNNAQPDSKHHGRIITLLSRLRGE